MKLAAGFFVVLGGYILRLGAGMVVFVLLARLLGPEAFGRFSFWLAVATLLSIPVNFGFGSMVLRRFGQAPERARDSMGEVLSAKFVLAGIAALLGLAGLVFIDSPVERAVFFFLLLAQISESFSEHYALGFRVNAQFTLETKVASVVAALHIVVMVATAMLWANVLVVAAAFAGSRLVGMLITRAQCQACIGKLIVAPLARFGDTLKRAWAYALELALFTAYGQVDTLIINALLGPAAVGLYQAGMKLVLGVTRIAPVLAQVLLPTLTRAADTREGFTGLAVRTVLAFAGAGAVTGIVMLIFRHQLTDLLFGRAYAELAGLLPLFGLVLFVRFFETGVGLLLVARGQQASKVWFVASQLAFVVVVGSIALASFGLAGWQWASVLATLLLLLAYAWLLSRPVSVPLSK